MKKIMLFAGLMLGAALSLTNCAQEEISSPASKSGRTMTIGASLAPVKTTNDGLQTLWSANDNLTIFHAPAGTTAYVKDGQFKTTEGGAASAEFTGTLGEELTPGARYDWYILNQYRGSLTSPTGTGVAYTVGVSRAQQAGHNSSAHIAGQGNYPMFGHIWNAAAEDALVVGMTHISSLVKVHVTNSTAASIRVSNVELIAKGQEISGNFYVDFTGEVPTFTGSGAKDYARLAVTGAPVLAAGAEADFFFSVKPFTAAAGDVLELRVNGYPKKLTLAEAVSFAPGHEKVLNFNYDAPDVDFSGEYMLGGYEGDKLFAAASIILAPGDYDGSGGTNTVMFAKKIRLDGTQIYYDPDTNVSELIPATIDDYKFIVSKVTEGDYAGMYTIKNAAGKYLTSYGTADSGGNSVTFEDEVSIPAYFDIQINGENAIDGHRIVATFSPARRHIYFNYNGGNYPRFTVFGEGENARLCAHLLPWGTPQVDPLPRIIPASIAVRAAGADGASLDIVTENNDPDNPWALEVDSFTAPVTEAFMYDQTLYYTVAANPSTEEGREGSIVVKLVCPDDATKVVTATFVVTQGRKPAKNFVKLTAAPTPDWCGDYLMVYEGEAGVGARAFDGSKGDVTGTDLDSGPSVAVVIEDGNTIPAEDNLLGCMLHIKFNKHKNAPAGSYGIWNTNSIRCIGVQGKNTATGIQLNDNTDDRFFQEITYDETNHSVRIYNTNAGGNTNTGVWRYSTSENRFGVIKDEEAADCAHIQLYKLVE